MRNTPKPGTLAVWAGEQTPMWERSTQVPVVHSVSFGYDDLDLPATTAALQPDQLPLTTIFAREVAKLKTAADPALGLYPPITAGAAPHIVKAFCTALAESRCDGAMLSFGATEEAVEKVLRMRIGKWLEGR